MSQQRGRLLSGKAFAGRLFGGTAMRRQRALVMRGGTLRELDINELGRGLRIATSDEGRPLVWKSELQSLAELDANELLEA